MPQGSWMVGWSIGCRLQSLKGMSREGGRNSGTASDTSTISSGTVLATSHKCASASSHRHSSLLLLVMLIKFKVSQFVRSFVQLYKWGVRFVYLSNVQSLRERAVPSASANCMSFTSSIAKFVGCGPGASCQGSRIAFLQNVTSG